MKRGSLIVSFLLFTIAVAVSQRPDIRTPEQTVRPIVDRTVRETAFELQPVPLKPALEIQVVDFRAWALTPAGDMVYARSCITSDRDTILRFGMSRDLPIKIVLNSGVVFSSDRTTRFVFREVGYEIFRFNDTLSFPIRKGRNELLVKARPIGNRNVMYLREITPVGKRPVSSFDLSADDPSLKGKSWMYLSGFGGLKKPSLRVPLAPDSIYRSSYLWNGAQLSWRFPEQQTVMGLRIKPEATYRRESYAEWQYPNGTVMLSLQSYADAAQDTLVRSFVQAFCNFTVNNLEMFRTQYERLHDFRGTNHKLIRQGMLDDTGAPALPFIEQMVRSHDPRFESIVADVARYVSTGQLRLRDGTFCRYEKIPGTVWADDLFMSAPFLVRMGRLKGGTKFFDDAARQAVNFNKYLEDKGTGLYRHGWYDAEKRQSPIAWGRANGWVIWAMTEILKDLPKSHPQRNHVVTIFRRHMKSIVSFQAASGLWHQVLDRPDSFEETSCTAMFIIGMARGMQMGILDRSFEPALQKAWSGLQSKVSDDGVVKDICRGTEMGEDFDFYNRRERFDNDPRGLGAVITACVEMMTMKNSLGRQ